MVPPAVDVLEANVAAALAAGYIDEAKARQMLYAMRCEIRATTAAIRRRPSTP